ncbi:MAG: LytR/AlgR family response regulator transcription factor [Aureispira sp.]
MLRTILVEDKFANLVLLETMLQPYQEQIEIIAKAQTLKDAVQLIQKLQPDLVFLDIHLPDGDGFEVLNQTAEQTFEVVFTTAFSKYTLKAFDVAAVHYLLKPIDEQALGKAVSRCLQNQKKKQLTTESKLLTPSIHSEKKIKKIIIPSHTEMVLINLEEVLYLEANRSYTQFYLKNGHSCISSKPIGVYEKQLRSTFFSRIHDKYIVNLECVTSYLKGRGGEVILSGHHSLQVSTRRKAQFIKELSDFISATE